LAAIADEMGLTVNAVEKWKAGGSYPASPKATLAMLDGLAKRKCIPKRRRYAMKQPLPLAEELVHALVAVVHFRLADGDCWCPIPPPTAEPHSHSRGCQQARTAIDRWSNETQEGEGEGEGEGEV